MMRTLLVALALGVGLLGAAPAAASGWGYELADTLMSPYCPGRALSECPSPNAEKLRQWILEQEQAGRSRVEVEEQLYAQFGEQLRQAPKAEGVGLVSYAVPLLLFLGGGVLVAVFFQRIRGAEKPAPPPATAAAVPASADADLERQLDEELGL